MRSKSLEVTNSRIMEGEDRISEVEDKVVEINESERKKEKRIKRNWDNLRDLWDNVKCPNIRIIGVPEEEDKKKDHVKIGLVSTERQTHIETHKHCVRVDTHTV